MSRFIKRYTSQTDAKSALDIISPNLTGVYENSDKKILCKEGGNPRYRSLRIDGTTLQNLHYVGDVTKNMGFEVLDGTVNISFVSVGTPSSTPTFEIGADEEQWESWSGLSKNLNAGSLMFIRGNNTTLGNIGESGYWHFVISGTGHVKVIGNVNSLLSQTSHAGLSLTGKNYCYYGLFDGCSSITSLDGFTMDSTELAQYCYSNTFRNCTGLTSVPEDLLPASTLQENCYDGMFDGCSSLIKAPVLAAEYFIRDCYSRMFRNCSSLNYIKCTASNVAQAIVRTENWVQGVQTVSGTFVQKATTGTSSWGRGVNGVPENWTIENA